MQYKLITNKLVGHGRISEYDKIYTLLNSQNSSNILLVIRIFNLICYISKKYSIIMSAKLEKNCIYFAASSNSIAVYAVVEEIQLDSHVHLH